MAHSLCPRAVRGMEGFRDVLSCGHTSTAPMSVMDAAHGQGQCRRGIIYDTTLPAIFVRDPTAIYVNGTIYLFQEVVEEVGEA